MPVLSSSCKCVVHDNWLLLPFIVFQDLVCCRLSMLHFYVCFVPGDCACDICGPMYMDIYTCVHVEAREGYRMALPYSLEAGKPSDPVIEYISC